MLLSITDGLVVESELTVRDADFANDSARLGGAASLLDFFNFTINDNSARVQGGDIYQVDIPSSLIGTSVFNNLAPLDSEIATIL